MAIYVGLDSSTQSLTAVVIEVTGSERRVVFQHSLRFDTEFPQYGTRNGVLPNEDPLIKQSSPRMWSEALDRMMAALSEQKEFRLDEVEAISGSGQQHGSVYLNREASTLLRHLDPKTPFVDQLDGMYSRRHSPIWMDASTDPQCEAITRDIGGEGVLKNLTGSQAFTRFTGPQIQKFHLEDPEGYENTDRIHLVSSFMATLLAGSHAPLDPGDASGMNLMDLARKRWAASALQVTAPDLHEKLPEIQESWSVIGNLSPYWVKRYGFRADTAVVIWSGDNPCSLIGVGLVSPGRVAISLGTSDTLFGFMPKPTVDPAGEGHAFGAPTGDYMSLICFVNGSLAREEIRSAYDLDWDGFSQALQQTRVGNRGGIMLPWFQPEITPHVVDIGVRRYGLDPEDGPANVRAVIEAQMMSMSIHSNWMQVKFETIHATGGASCNRDILRIMADVHNAEVFQFEVGNSAALGAALRAYHAAETKADRNPTWEDIVKDFTEPVRESRIQPDPTRVAIYDELKVVYGACEDHALRGGEDPAERIEAFRKAHGGGVG